MCAAATESLKQEIPQTALLGPWATTVTAITCPAVMITTCAAPWAMSLLTILSVTTIVLGFGGHWGFGGH